MLQHAELLRLVRYDPATGNFVWLRHDRTGEHYAGTITGATEKTHYYKQIMIRRRRYPVHRLAFFYVTGRRPANVDHINQIKSDNRWCNLREASKRENAANTRLYKSNTTGWKGVCRGRKPGGKWTAQINKKHIGSFDCPAAAHFAYLIEAHKSFGEFA